MKRRRQSDALATAIGVILIGLLIQCAGVLKHERLVFPDALEILRAFFRLLGEGTTWRMMGTTLMHLLIALLAATLIGVPLGLAEGLSRFANRLFRPLISFIRAIPMIVLIIMVMVLADYARVPVIAAALMLIPPISEASPRRATTSAASPSSRTSCRSASARSFSGSSSASSAVICRTAAVGA